MRFAIVVLLVAACGGKGASTVSATSPKAPVTVTERILALLPEGVQIVVELDLARLRANAVVGEVASQLLDELAADAKLPGLPLAAQGSPLAAADVVVLAAYGVGTTQAATVTILATRGEVPNATRLAPDLVALGPDEWIRQLEARAAIAARQVVVASSELMLLRDHAMPPNAPGSVLRITARLPFDARVALARQTGLEFAPARLSVWADVVDDFAVIIDADAADPGDKKGKDAVRRLETTIKAVLTAAAREPGARALGLPASLEDARLVTQGTWVRTIIAIGPRHLARVVERARTMLKPAS